MAAAPSDAEGSDDTPDDGSRDVGATVVGEGRLAAERGAGSAAGVEA